MLIKSSDTVFYQYTDYAKILYIIIAVILACYRLHIRHRYNETGMKNKYRSSSAFYVLQ